MAADRSWWRVTPSLAGWVTSCRLANLSLRAGGDVFWVQCDDERGLRRGDLLIGADPEVAPVVAGLGERLSAPLQPWGVPDPAVCLRIGTARVAVYGGGGAPYNHGRILAEAGFDVTFISAQAIQAGALRDFDALVVPGGGHTANRGQLRLLAEEGAREITRFVEAGGMYLGSCAGAHNVCVIPIDARPPFGQRFMQLVNVGLWHLGDAEWHWREFPGVGVIQSRNLRPDHPVMFGLPEQFEITHYNGPLFALSSGALDGASDAVPLASVTGVTPSFTPGEHALSFSQYRGIAPGSVIERAISKGAINVALGLFGLGRVVVFGSHPEFGFTLEMDDLQAPARMLANAVLWQSTFRAHDRRQRPDGAQASDSNGVPISAPSGTGLHLIAARTSAIREVVRSLRAQSLDPRPTWLGEDRAMSTFGLPAETIWRRALDGFERVEGLLRETVTHLQALVATPIDRVADACLELERALHYAAPDAWEQDVGYQGVLRTLDETRTLLARALASFGVDLAASQDPYAHDDVSPYHLVAACYYSALGMLLNAWSLLRMHERRLEDLILLHEARRQAEDGLASMAEAANAP